MKNSNCVKKNYIKFDDFRNDGKKKNLRRPFWELSDEIENKIWCGFKYFINDVYVLYKKFLKLGVRW